MVLASRSAAGATALRTRLVSHGARAPSIGRSDHVGGRGAGGGGGGETPPPRAPRGWGVGAPRRGGGARAAADEQLDRGGEERQTLSSA